MKVLQGTLFLVKLPRGCPLHNGRYAWSPGYVSSHLYCCHPPMSIIRGCALLPHQPISHWAPLSLGGSSVCGRTLNPLSALYSFLGAMVGSMGNQWPRTCLCTNPKKYLLPFTNHISNASILNADLWICISEGFLSLKLDATALLCLCLFPPKSPGSIPRVFPCFTSALPLPLSNLSRSHFSETPSLTQARRGFYLSAQPPCCTV